MTAPVMMLLPYIKEPATGSRMPSMSTGGAPMKATMKQMVAERRVGIIRYAEPAHIEAVVGGGDPATKATNVP